jgi:hypothetical protein
MNKRDRKLNCVVPMHIYEVHRRSDKRGVDLISDALPFGQSTGIAGALLDRAFIAEPMSRKAAWQQANPFHNISHDRGGA